jgi:transposase
LGSCEAVAVKQHSADLRERLLEAIDAGLPQAETALLFSIGVSTIRHWRRRRRETGVATARARLGRRPRMGPVATPMLVAQVRAAPDATLAEHCTWWESATGIWVSRATMSRALQRAGWPLKKGRSWPPSEMSPPARHGGTRPPLLTQPT